MSRESIRRVEELLRHGAADARRAPSPALRAGIASALESSAPAPERALASSTGERALAHSTGQRALASSTGDGLDVRTSGRRAWRGRVQDALVAACVLAAIGVWGFAFLRESPSGVQPNAGTDSTARGSLHLPGDLGSIPIESSASPVALAQLARATPRSLHTAIDGSLLGELGNIVHDATQAAQFLVGRVPAPLVTRATDESPR